MNTKVKKQVKDEVGERKQAEGRLEAVLYPLEFLGVMQDTMFEGLKGYLIRSDAPAEAVGLLDDLQILMTWKAQVDGSEGQLVDRLVNDMLCETIASGMKHVVKVGGVLYGPYGDVGGR